VAAEAAVAEAAAGSDPLAGGGLPRLNWAHRFHRRDKASRNGPVFAPTVILLPPSKEAGRESGAMPVHDGARGASLGLLSVWPRCSRFASAIRTLLIPPGFSP
jgi:hypothetical protein